jgi:hypothetical protein
MDPMNGHRDGAVGARARTPMNDPSMRAMHINQLKDRVSRSAYTVDADAVAEALLSRPAARRSILPAGPVSRRDARSRRANGSGRQS